MRQTLLTIVAILATTFAAQAYDTWTVVGTNTVVNGDGWIVGNTANDMTSTNNGVDYTLVLTNWTFASGTAKEYKMVKNHSYSYGQTPQANTNSKVNAGTGSGYTLIYYLKANDNLEHSALAFNSSTTMYMKHPWDGTNRTWKKLTYDSNSKKFYVLANWYNTGVNINNTQNDNYNKYSSNGNGSCVYINPESITVNGDPSNGDECYFMLDASTGKVTVSKSDCYEMYGGGSDIVNTNESNIMTYDATTGNYTLTVSDKQLEAGVYYPAVKNALGTTLASPQEGFGVCVAGKYDIIYSYNASSKTLSTQLVHTDAADYYLITKWNDGKGNTEVAWKPLIKSTGGSDAGGMIYPYYLVGNYGEVQVSYAKDPNAGSSTYVTPDYITVFQQYDANNVTASTHLTLSTSDDDMPHTGDLCIFYFNPEDPSILTDAGVTWTDQNRMPNKGNTSIGTSEWPGTGSGTGFGGDGPGTGMEEAPRRQKTNSLTLSRIGIQKTSDTTPVVTSITDVKTSESAASKAVKVIEDGQMVIIKDGVRYNLMGGRLN